VTITRMKNHHYFCHLNTYMDASRVARRIHVVL
jgi:hypothetical protein